MAFSAMLTTSSLSALQVPSPGPGMGLGGSEADKAGVPSIQEETQQASRRQWTRSSRRRAVVLSEWTLWVGSAPERQPFWPHEAERDLRQRIRCFLKPLEAWAIRWPAGSCTPCHCQENEDQQQVMGAWLRKTWEEESRNREVPRNAPGCHHGWVQPLLPQRSLGGWQNPPPAMPSLCSGTVPAPRPLQSPAKAGVPALVVAGFPSASGPRAAVTTQHTRGSSRPGVGLGAGGPDASGWVPQGVCPRSFRWSTGLTPPLPSSSPDVLCLHSGIGVPVPLFVRMLGMSD